MSGKRRELPLLEENFKPLTIRQPVNCSVCGSRGAAIGTLGADLRLCRKCLSERGMRMLRNAHAIMQWLEENPAGLEWKERAESP